MSSQKFLTTISSSTGFEEVQRRYRQYHDYLASIRGRMPPGAKEFADAVWHYDPNDHRCPHDSWIKNLSIEEAANGLSEPPSLTIKLLALGAYRDGLIEIEYTDVGAYSLLAGEARGVFGTRHGDWLVDELRLTGEGNCVEHEIIFANQVRWVIACADLRYTWTPFTANKT